MAEDLAETLPAVAKPQAASRRREALRGRFLAAYLVLGLIAGAAIAGAFMLFTEVDRQSYKTWGSWHPVGNEATYGQQIADHVGVRYRTPNGDQIVGVVPGPPRFQTASGYLEVRAVLIRSLNQSSTPDIHAVPTEETFMYQLCGLDDFCTVTGKTTEERHRLLRREALELALYTFKYIKGVKQVIALLPPRNPQQPANAVYLEKDDVKAELQQPLAETIGRPDARSLVEVPELETVRVDRLTLPFLFNYALEPLPNSAAGLILTPVKPAD